MLAHMLGEPWPFMTQSAMYSHTRMLSSLRPNRAHWTGI
jgi:hypothetical protein